MKSSQIVVASKGNLATRSAQSQRQNRATNSAQGGAILPYVKNFGFSDSILKTMNDHYPIDISDISTWTKEDFGHFTDVAEQFKYLVSIIPQIEKDWEAIVNGTTEWADCQARLVKLGFTGASKIKKSTIDMAIAELKHQGKEEEQDHRLIKKGELITDETKNNKELQDRKTTFLLKHALTQVEQKFSDFESNYLSRLELSAEASDWQEALPDPFEEARLFLKHGSAAATHPRLAGSAQSGQQFGGWGSPSQQSRSQSSNRKPDSISFNWSGNIAQKVANTGKAFGSGIKKIRNFFG